MPARGFTPFRAARLTRPGKKISAVSKKLVRRGKRGLVDEVAKFVLKQVPYNAEKTLRVKNFTRIRFNQSLSKRANTSAAKISPTGLLPCVERCTLAVSLMRKSGIKAWLARAVSLDKYGKESIHDFVEFYKNGKVNTLSLGISRAEEGTWNFVDTYSIFNGPVNERVQTGEIQSVFRGIDSSQIGGATSSKKLVRFLRESFYPRQKEKEKRRLSLLVSSGVIPKEVAAQLKMS